nr:O-antigen ligase family protein [Wenjunlia vitaminophila]
MATGSMPSSHEQNSNAPDLVGAAFLVCCALWALISAAGRDARPEGFLLALLAVVAGYAAGRIAGAVLPLAAPALAAFAVVAVVGCVPDGLSGEPLAPPLGYSNANAALLTLAAGAACCAAWATRITPLRLALRLLAVTAAGMSLALGSLAGGAAAFGVVLCSLAAARVRRRLLGLAALALCSAAVVTSTFLVGADRMPEPDVVRTQLTEERVSLWHDAVALVEKDPLRGVGPDRFGQESPAARGEADADKARSAGLQQAAEQGVPGVLLLSGAYLWTFFALWRSGRSTPVVLTAAAALTGLAAQASVDSVLSYAAVTSGAGLLAGMATARRLTDEPADEDEPGPRSEPDRLPTSAGGWSP